MYILGINAFHGDSSACILKNGIVLCAIEEERIKRIKHWAGFPIDSIRFCLENVGISIDEVDYITISRDPKSNLFKKIIYSLKYSRNFKNISSRIFNSFQVRSIKNELASSLGVPLSKINAECFNIEHHRSHIASSFFASSFKQSAIISIDGFGDFTSTMFAYGTDNNFNVIKELNYPHSLGVFYTSVTQFLGFPNYGDEYKVMGLAPYGKPKYLKEFENVIRVNKNGLFTLNKKYFNHFNEGVSMSWNGGVPSVNSLFTSNWKSLFGNPRIFGGDLKQLHFDLASSAQVVTEKVVFHMLKYLYKSTKCDNICISGGVAQNSVLNGKILKNSPFKHIYVPSAAHDAGTAIGSALYLYNQILNNSRNYEINTAYLGGYFTNDKIVEILDDAKIDYKHYSEDDLLDTVTDKLLNGGVVGWFHGKAEFGPRALGHRSILVDPRRIDAKDLLNKKIKLRESFRPFAPSILKERISDYFLQSDISPFMEKVFKFRKEKYEEVPAVVHEDGTGRLHSVDINTSPRFYKLISLFAQKTGIPILLNTSFNENEPIVNSPEQAISCFLRTDMDMLVIEDIIIQRS